MEMLWCVNAMLMLSSLLCGRRAQIKVVHFTSVATIVPATSSCGLMKTELHLPGQTEILTKPHYPILVMLIIDLTVAAEMKVK